MVTARKILNLILLLSFVSVAVFGVFTVMPSHHHEPGCPFMTGEQSICPMGLLEHISAWKATLAVLIPSLLTILVLAGFARYFSQKFYLPDLPSLPAEPNLLAPIQTLYQNLFSDGILNPKAP